MTQLQKVMLDFISLGPPTDLALLLLELDNFATQWRIRSCLKYLPNETAARSDHASDRHRFTVSIVTGVCRLGTGSAQPWSCGELNLGKNYSYACKKLNCPRAATPRLRRQCNNPFEYLLLRACNLNHPQFKRGSVSRKRSTTTWEPS